MEATDTTHDNSAALPALSPSELNEALMADLIYCEPSEMFARLLYGSEFEYGVLFLAEEMPDGWFPDYMIACPEDMKSGWTVNHELCVARHPEKGILLLGATQGPLRRKRVAGAVKNAEVVLLDLKALAMEHLYPDSCEIVLAGVPMHTAVFLYDFRRRDLPKLHGIAGETVIFEDQLTELPTRLNQILDHYEAHRPVINIDPDLFTRLKALGNWIPTEHMLEDLLNCCEDLI